MTSTSYSRLQAAHIFPRVHDAEWCDRGFPSKITDSAKFKYVGGPSKIDSVQNVIMLRNDLHAAWDKYEFGVNPDKQYRITSFINGNSDVDGRCLQLDHIQDPTLRPLDELFRDHFLQGVLKHVRGAADVSSDDLEFDDTFDNGSVDLSKHSTWSGEKGKKWLEFEVRNRLFDYGVSQDVEPL